MLNTFRILVSLLVFGVMNIIPITAQTSDCTLAFGTVTSIGLIDLDGSNMFHIRSGRRDSGDFSWSPDGELLAFVGGDDSYDLQITNTDGTNIKVLAQDVFQYDTPRWNADGSMIVFTSTQFETYQPNQIVDIVSGDIYPVGDASDLPTGSHQDPFWSPDGTQIVFMFEDRITSDDKLYIYDFETDTYRYLTKGSRPQWSPDGTRILYSFQKLTDTIEYEHTVIGVDGRNQKWFATGEALTRVRWSPNGKYIAHWSGDGIYIYDAETLEELKYVADRSDAFRRWDPGIFDWSPDSTHIAFSSQANTGVLSHIYAVEVETDRIFQISSEPQAFSRVAWSPKCVDIDWEYYHEQNGLP